MPRRYAENDGPEINNLDSYPRCEALVDEPAWTRIGDSAQCSRWGSRREDRAGAILCWQHERFVESRDELPLTGDRMLVVDWRWSEDGWRREVVGARILENAVDLEHRRRDQPSPGWGSVTDEQRRATAEFIRELLDGRRGGLSDND